MWHKACVGIIVRVLCPDPVTQQRSCSLTFVLSVRNFPCLLFWLTFYFRIHIIQCPSQQYVITNVSPSFRHWINSGYEALQRKKVHVWFCNMETVLKADWCHAHVCSTTWLDSGFNYKDEGETFNLVLSNTSLTNSNFIMWFPLALKHFVHYNWKLFPTTNIWCILLPPMLSFG